VLLRLGSELCRSRRLLQLLPLEIERVLPLVELRLKCSARLLAAPFLLLLLGCLVHARSMCLVNEFSHSGWQLAMFNVQALRADRHVSRGVLLLNKASDDIVGAPSGNICHACGKDQYSLPCRWECALLEEIILWPRKSDNIISRSRFDRHPHTSASS